ncbi:MAG: thioredoxin family protein [Syntrophomonadaceae bacterium]|jgi:thiol-disulfide isomerase/thioredoxin|nr:thioredoxin family protein [Syntrophomonadaceae bacterium]
MTEFKEAARNGKTARIVILTVVLIAVAAILALKFMPNPYQGENRPQPGSVRLAEATAAGLPVILIFSSAGCPACVEFDKILQRVMPDYQGRVAFIKVNVADKRETELVRQYQIRYVPTLFLIDKDGKPRAHAGFVEEEVLRQAIDKLLL